MVINQKNIGSVRDAAILTGSYVNSTAFEVKTFDLIELHIDFTIGSLTSMELALEKSVDGGTTWRSDANLVINTEDVDTYSSYLQFTATTSCFVRIPTSGGQYRVKAKGTGVVTSSSLAVSVVLYAHS